MELQDGGGCDDQPQSELQLQQDKGRVKWRPRSHWWFLGKKRGIDDSRQQICSYREFYRFMFSCRHQPIILDSIGMVFLAQKHVAPRRCDISYF